ncbi:lipoprotein NlpI [Pseudoruegeria aquimaris]|uniref:Lipoprotein NlpI n=1 Tax=Pseudoruegeria aquimaris TaxID=393663 RepID=A0A1Y5TNE3_9RHOB|nr:tetratricopeptide repeat protein [Pseudoruegeria aquimaris]SLN68062.1 lipoprotein NlpI [Pseudoruegeria aquimaris]
MRVIRTQWKALAVLATMGASVLAPGAQAQDGLAGAYLAARHASVFSDYEAAADYFTRALVLDPGNPALMENALTAFLGLGELDRAVPIARRMVAGGINSQTAHMTLLIDQFLKEDYAAAIADLQAGRSVGQLVDGLAVAWALVGEGEMSEALAAFDGVSEQPGLAAFGLFHKALALASVGDFEGADEIFSGETGVTLQATRRGVMAHAQVLGQLDRHQDAIELIDAVAGRDLDPEVQSLRDRLAAGEEVPFDIVQNPKEGLSEVFSMVAEALRPDAQPGYTLLYSRAAEVLHPGQIEAILMSAGLLEQLERYELATETYDKVPPDHPSFHAAELGRSQALMDAGKPEASLEVLKQLTKTHGDLPQVWVTLGDRYRQMERFDEASGAYDKALELYGEPNANHWFVFYARGITHEREGRWELAEADFRKSLELVPGQPQVLNYLGYSMVEMRQNLDEALEMIEEAVAARPDDGYITDSLGWVLYRLGRYEEAVVHMERAAELMPVDPIINDHLGDTYWAVGRHLEAEFQWRRALSFDPEPEEAERIRRKLEVGLDKVLEEEGADPISVANDG